MSFADFLIDHFPNVDFMDFVGNDLSIDTFKMKFKMDESKRANYLHYNDQNRNNV